MRFKGRLVDLEKQGDPMLKARDDVSKAAAQVKRTALTTESELVGQMDDQMAKNGQVNAWAARRTVKNRVSAGCHSRPELSGRVRNRFFTFDYRSWRRIE